MAYPGYTLLSTSWNYQPTESDNLCQYKITVTSVYQKNDNINTDEKYDDLGIYINHYVNYQFVIDKK